MSPECTATERRECLKGDSRLKRRVGFHRFERERERRARGEKKRFFFPSPSFHQSRKRRHLKLPLRGFARASVCTSVFRTRWRFDEAALVVTRKTQEACEAGL